jgi:poly-gamma-glutamate synthase PgsB/CapB
MFEFYAMVSILFIAFFLLERMLLNQALQKIPIRILVNGTRGKSTTVLILYRIFRNCGKTVFAKTTGDRPLIYFPDGRTKILKRFAPASIIENIFLLIRWAKKRPVAVIMECMALQPETQNRLGQAIFKPTHAIITNILPDHKEVMGNTLAEESRTIGECISNDCEIFIPEETETLTHWLKLPETNIHRARRKTFDVRFEHIPQSVVNQSWTLIAEVANAFRLDKVLVRNTFVNVWQHINQNIRSVLLPKHIRFYNLFSVNDVASCKQFVEHALKNRSRGCVFLMNCRADRPLRTKDFVWYLREEHAQAEVWLTGDGQLLARRFFKKNKMNAITLSFETALQKIKTDLPENAVIFGIANHRGSELFLEGVETLKIFSEGEQ